MTHSYHRHHRTGLRFLAANISVCIPNYNRADNLRQVLHDCIQQTIQPYEIIVQDDSTDLHEIKKIKRLMKRYPHVRYALNKKNIGLAANVNRVIKKARGNYVVIVNNDDRLSSEYIEQLEQALKKYPNFNVYATNACAIDDRLSVIGEYRIARCDAVIKKRTGIEMLWGRYMINLISISGAMMYRRSYIQSHLFDTSFGNETDLKNALHMLSTENIMYIDVPIYFVRMNAQNTSVQIRAETEDRNNFIDRCLTIYRSYEHNFRKVHFFPETPKSIYFLQLFGKYRYPWRNVLEMLAIKDTRELFRVLILAARYPFIHGYDLLQFQLHKKTIERFAPTQ